MSKRIKNRFISLIQFSRENTYVTIKHMEKCHNAPIIQKSKLKTRFHITREIVLMRIPSAGELIGKWHNYQSPLQNWPSIQKPRNTLTGVYADRTPCGQITDISMCTMCKQVHSHPRNSFLRFNLRRRVQNIRGGKLYIQSFITELHRTTKNKQPKHARIWKKIKYDKATR